MRETGSSGVGLNMHFLQLFSSWCIDYATYNSVHWQTTKVQKLVNHLDQYATWFRHDPIIKK